MLSARKRGAAINPSLQGTEGNKKVFMRHDPTAQRPADRTDEQLRDQALQGDDNLQAGIAHTSTQHACQLTGLISSHVFMKLCYWDDAACRDAGCMHTTTDEVKSIADMLIGSTESPPAYHTSRLDQQAEYEVHVNDLFEEQLQAFAQGASFTASWKCALVDGPLHTYCMYTVVCSFVTNTASIPISLTDSRGYKRFGEGNHKDRFNWQAELHLHYLKFPGLC